MKIAVFADPHIGVAKSDFVANSQIGIAAINRLQPDLCVVLGDLTLDGANSDADSVFAREQLGALTCAVAVLPGNHDVGDVGRGGRQPADQTRLARWAGLFGETFWARDLGDDWRLIGINSQILSTGLGAEEEQWRLVEHALATLGARRAIVFLHQPLFMQDWDEEDRAAWAVLSDSRQRLKALMAAHPVSLVVSAHVHRAQIISQAGMPSIVWTPATSFLSRDASMPDQDGKAILGITLIDLGGDEPVVSFLSDDAYDVRYIEDFHGAIYPPPGS